MCHYVVWSREADRAQDFRLVGGGRAYGRPQNFAGTFPRLWRNDGGRFSDVSAEAGIQVRNPATGVPAAKSLGVACDDLDGDGRIAIVVANDTVQNFLFHNVGGGRFEELAGPSGVAYDTEGRARGAMGIDIGYFRNDDEVGILIGNFANEMSALYVSTGRQLQFRDDAVANGLGPETRQELTFGVLFADVDLDGRPDIVQANGHLEEDINKVQRTQFYEQSPELFWNCGPDEPTEFVAVPAATVGEGFHRPLVGRGLATADLDGDGDADFVLTASGGPARLVRNDQATGHHWIRIRLEDAGLNRGAVGAMVELRGPAGGPMQRRCVSAARSYQSQSELPVTFGLGTAAEPVTIQVRRPDGTVTTHADLAVDRLHVVRRDGAAQ
ncbi:MAG: CRTAC1 family protein [Planctomycetota bacterium]